MTDGTPTMWQMIATLPDQLRWGVGRAIDGPAPATTSEVLVAGMGGSGIAGDVLGLLAELASSRVSVVKDYRLPRWAETVRPLVVAVSYSGNTEETIAVVDAARTAGLDVAVVSSGGVLGERAAAEGLPRVVVPGGLQPRAALGYLVSAVTAIARSAGAVDDPAEDLAEAADVVAGLLADMEARTGGAHGLARDLAEGLDGRIAVIYGSVGPSGVAAMRWKTQINENAKAPAWWNVLPELDHNEIVGWQASAELTRRTAAVVALRDRHEHPQVARRFVLTADLIADDVPVIGEVIAQGEAPLARALSLCVVGDLTSTYLAERLGVDPVPVPAIEELKRRLAADAEPER